MLYPKKYMGIQSVSPLHLLDIPMLMNSKFYDKYIEIEFPSLYGIGVRDHNVYDEDGNKIYKFLDSEKEFRLKQNDSTAVE